MIDRPNVDEYFFNIVDAVKKRSTCLRRNVGAVAVKDKRILATGYNGPPTGYKHCDVEGCKREQLNIPSGKELSLCVAIHAEMNLIVQCARHGVSMCGSTVYCNTQPCVVCVKMMLNVGVEEILYRHFYPDELSLEMMMKTGSIEIKADTSIWRRGIL